MTHLSLMVLHGMVNGFIELDKAVVHVGEGNATPLQYSCLENPMDGGARRAAVHEVATSQTQLKQLSSSSSSYNRDSIYLKYTQTQAPKAPKN